MLATMGGFPSEEPTAYTLIKKYTASGTFTAPESGYFQIEVFGASGSGGAVYRGKYYIPGGGGGGGGYACSRIKLKKGDKVIYTIGRVGATSSANIGSSVEAYNNLQVTSGNNGGNGSESQGGYGRSGGYASGGNYANLHGGSGSNAGKNTSQYGKGGSPGYSGGNYGGDGYNGVGSGGAGKAGFIKIYRGNTN